MKYLTLLFLGSGLYAQTLVPTQFDDMDIYATQWDGSMASGTVFTISVPSNVQTAKKVYPMAVTIVVNAQTTITVRKGSPTDPTSLCNGEITSMNTGLPPVFNSCPNATIGSGGKVTKYDIGPGTSVGTAITIPFNGASLGRGRSSGRNISVHVGVATGIVNMTWLVGQK